jgi:multicomponent Na+:H+ antiporter subunit G
MELLASIVVLAGSVLMLSAAVGMMKFGDLFARMHAATKPATLGLMLILSGAALMMPGVDAVMKLLLVVLLQFITAPVGAHLLGRASFRSGIGLDPDTQIDEESRALRTKGVSDG